MVMNGTPTKFRKVRFAKNLTQQKVAEMAGVSLPTVLRLDNGKGDPKLSKVKAIANALGVKIDDIVQCKKRTAIQAARKLVKKRKSNKIAIWSINIVYQKRGIQANGKTRVSRKKRSVNRKRETV